MNKSNSAEDTDNNILFVSRQPIYSPSSDLFAYELLYSLEVIEQVLAARGERAGADVFLKTLQNAGLEPILGDTLAFINITPTFILEDYCKALPKEKVVFEIRGHAEPDEAVVRSLSALRQSGYNFALDEFAYTEQTRPILELANYAYLNFQGLTPEEISKQLAMLKQSNVKAIAKRVDTHAELDLAKSMGFEYFKGSSFTRPKVTTSARVPVNRLSTLQLVLKLQEADLESAELEKIVKQDLAISYKLLQYVNSAAVSLPRTVESIKTAIQLIGTERLRTWASLLYLSKLDDKPAELIITALVRAKMAEGLATAMGVKNVDTYYMVGLFSLVDAMLNVPMSEAIQLLPFSKEIRDALLKQEGSCGSVLKCVLSYETGDWNQVSSIGLDAATIRRCYLDSVSAARNMPKTSKSAGSR